MAAIKSSLPQSERDTAGPRNQAVRQHVLIPQQLNRLVANDLIFDCRGGPETDLEDHVVKVVKQLLFGSV